MPQRARSEADKQARRRHLLDAAVELLASERYDGLTMAAIARAAGVAKGTLYLYFSSKEELFLAALQEAYVAWLADTRAALDALEAPSEPEIVADTLVSVLSGRSRFLRLMALLHGVLEANATAEAVYAFKVALVEHGLQTAMSLVRVCPWLQGDDAGRFLLRLHAMLAVVHQMAEPAPVVAEVLERPELSMLALDFDDELRSLLADLLIARRVGSGRAR